MRDCIERAGFDFKLIEQELKRYDDDTEAQVLYLKNLYDASTKVHEDLVSFQEIIKPEIIKEELILKKVLVRISDAYEFINQNLSKIKSNHTKAVLECIGESNLVQTYSALSDTLEDIIEDILDVKWEIYNMMGKRKLLIQSRPSNTFIRIPEKIYWMKSEKLLIQTFEKLIEYDFIIIENSLLDTLASHFIIINKMEIPPESKVSFSKFIWRKSTTQLANFYKALIESKTISVPKKNRHPLLVAHFNAEAGTIDSDSFSSTYEKTKWTDIQDALDSNFEYPAKYDYGPDELMLEVLRPLTSQPR